MNIPPEGIYNPFHVASPVMDAELSTIILSHRLLQEIAMDCVAIVRDDAYIHLELPMCATVKLLFPQTHQMRLFADATHEWKQKST